METTSIELVWIAIDPFLSLFGRWCRWFSQRHRFRDEAFSENSASLTWRAATSSCLLSTFPITYVQSGSPPAAAYWPLSSSPCFPLISRPILISSCWLSCHSSTGWSQQISQRFNEKEKKKKNCSCFLSDFFTQTVVPLLRMEKMPSVSDSACRYSSEWANKHLDAVNVSVTQSVKQLLARIRCKH